MAGESSVNFSLLHRTCKLVVLLCFLHISVTVVFYVRSLDIRFSFVQNQQSHNNVTQPNLVRNPEVTSQTDQLEIQKDVKAEDQHAEPKTNGKETEGPAKKLEKCPETSPLLGTSDYVWLPV